MQPLQQAQMLLLEKRNPLIEGQQMSGQGAIEGIFVPGLKQ